jgi:hypothetical protein
MPTQVAPVPEVPLLSGSGTVQVPVTAVYVLPVAA